MVHWKSAVMELNLPMSFSVEARAKFIQIAAHAKNDFLGVQFLAGVCGRAVFGAAAAFHAGVGLQTHQLREVCSGNQAEIFIAHQRRNLAEATPGKKDGGWAENEMQMLGVRDDGQEDQQGERVCPPENACGGAGIADRKACQIRHHQEEDE